MTILSIEVDCVLEKSSLHMSDWIYWRISGLETWTGGVPVMVYGTTVHTTGPTYILYLEQIKTEANL